MIFLKNSNFIGVHSRHGITKLNFEKRMTVLTGFNGAGKSTILSGIFLSLENIGQRVQRPLFSAKKDWGIELNLVDDGFYDEYKKKIPGINLPNTKLNINVKNLITKPYLIEAVQAVSKKVDGKEKLDLYHYYNFIETEFEKESENLNITSKNFQRVENTTNIYSVAVTIEKPLFLNIDKVMNLYNRDLRTNGDKVTVAFYKDEQIFYSKFLENSNDLSGLDVFSQNNNLDKSIFLLLSDFRSRVLSSDKILSQSIAEEFEFNKNKISNYSNYELNVFFESLISKKRFSTDALNFVDKLNLFFNQINKTAYLEEDGLISFKEIIKNKRGDIERIVKWFDCSKGEKTLLCLLLMVFLYRDNNTIYLFDEPDLAMHIEWQRILLPTLLEIAPNSQFIISTHSPALVPRDVSEVGFINVSKLKEKVEYESE